MTSASPDQKKPALSVIIPANNESALIGHCLHAIGESDWDGPAVQVIVVANGCTDDTVEVARAQTDLFVRRGWFLDVIDQKEGGKLAALNAGDAIVRADIRIYLDADVTVTPLLLGQLHGVLDTDAPRYASGTLQMTARSWVSRNYVRIYRKVPFMSQGVPGCGVFAVNAAGRARWGAFPQIISDDTYVRLHFAPSERIGVPAGYKWPVVEGLRNLIKVRRRQDVGVSEIARRFPALLKNDDKPELPFSDKLKMAAKDPMAFLVYASVAIAGKLTPSGRTGWDRGR